MSNTVTTYENTGFIDVNALMIDVVKTLVGTPTVLPIEGNALPAGQMYFAPVAGGNYGDVFTASAAGVPGIITPPAATAGTVLVLEATQLVDPFALLDPKGGFIATNPALLNLTATPPVFQDSKLTAGTPAPTNISPPVDLSQAATDQYPNNPTKDPWRITFQSFPWRNYSSFTAAPNFAASGPSGSSGPKGTWNYDKADDTPLSLAIYLGTPATMSTEPGASAGTGNAGGLVLGWVQQWPNKYPIWADSALNGGCTYYDWLGPVNVAQPAGTEPQGPDDAIGVNNDRLRLKYALQTAGVAVNQLREIGVFLKSYNLMKSYDFVEPIGNVGAEWTHPFDPVLGGSAKDGQRFGTAKKYATGSSGANPNINPEPGWPGFVTATGPSGASGYLFGGVTGVKRINLANDPNNVKYQWESGDYVPGSAGDGPDVQDPAQLFINRYPIRAVAASGPTGSKLTSTPAGGMFAFMAGKSASTNALSYRLVFSDHGMFLAVWGENPEETASNYSWLLIQRPVNKTTGVIRGIFDDFYYKEDPATPGTWVQNTGPTGVGRPARDALRNDSMYINTAYDINNNPINTGNRPLFCINSTGNKFFKFVVREHDLPIPSHRKNATNNYEDSGAVLNAFRQQSLTENGEYVITFINNLNSNRFKYADELDMVGTVSADIVGGGTDIDVSVYGEKDPMTGQPSKRTYHALWPSGQYGTKMRIVVVKRVPNPNAPERYKNVE